jgi:hypothetical protein
MHAEANGWYNLAGALGGMGEQYHVGNSERHFPRQDMTGRPAWDKTEYRKPTEEECLQIFAGHCRITIAEAREIAKRVRYDAAREFAPDIKKPRQRWVAIMETMRPRWKQEAEACIANHKLVVYGDKWENAA